MDWPGDLNQRIVLPKESGEHSWTTGYLNQAQSGLLAIAD